MTVAIKGGSTSRMIHVALFDATTGLPYTTGAFGDAGIALWYRRGVAGAKTTITPATQTVTGAYSSGGFVVVAENVYRLDLPDAALATGVDEVQIGGSATAWRMIAPTIQIVGYDPRTELTTAVLAFIDAAVSSRSTYAGTDTAGTTTLLSRLSAARAGYLDNLSAGAVALQSTLSTLSTTVSGLAAAVWAYATRTVTLTAAQIAAILDGTALTVHRGDTLSQSITGLGSISGRLALWLTVKENPQSDADSASKVQLTEAAGLTYLNGAAAATPGDGSLVVTSAAAGDVTVTLAAAATAALVGGKVYSYDIQVKDASGAIRTIAEGSFRVVADVTRATT